MATGMAVSLIQSNAAGWGAGIVVPGTGVFLQNRGIGFSLEAGHPAELAPGRRPPHTLAPALVTRADGDARRRAGHAWAATSSRRSCCSSSPACCSTANRRAPR